MVASAIRGKVAKVLNDREVVINRGKDHGVELGTRFKLLETVEIQDPDTRDGIGTITREKIRFMVVHLQPSMSIARTYETHTFGSSSASQTAERLLQSIRPQASMQRTDVKRIRPAGDSDEPVLVEIGDIVDEVTDDE
jgi:hypothetical protein